MKKIERDVNKRRKYNAGDVVLRIYDGYWKYALFYYDKDGKQRVVKESTGIKYEEETDSKGKKKKKKGPPTPPEIVSSMFEELSSKLVEKVNDKLYGTYKSPNSFLYWLDKYRIYRRTLMDVSETTKKSDEGRFNGIKKYDKFDKPIGEITKDDIVEFLNKLSESGLSKNTVQQYKLIIKGTLKHAVDNKAIDKNPADKLGNYRDKSIHKITSDEVLQGDEILNFVLDCKDLTIYPCILLASTLGLRRSECLGLRWDKVHIPGFLGCKETPGFDFGYIEVVQKIINCDPNVSGACHRDGCNESFKISSDMKTNSSKREVCLPNTDVAILLVELFESQLRNRKIALESWNTRWGGTPLGSSDAANNTKFAKIWDTGKPDYGYVCVNALGEIISPWQVDNSWKHIRKMEKYADRVGHIRFHDLRHSFASYLVNNLVPIYNVSKILGHSSVATTNNFYVHADSAANFKAISQTQISKSNRILDSRYLNIPNVHIDAINEIMGLCEVEPLKVENEDELFDIIIDQYGRKE